MIPRPFPPAVAACLLLGFAVLPAAALPPGARPAVAATPAPTTPSIVYRSDETDATAQGLASQPQFSGTGIIAIASESGTGNIIAPNWVLTAQHVVTADGSITSPAANSVTFYYAGGNQVSNGVYLDPQSDMALVHFATALPSNLAIIPPNLNGTTKVQPVGALVWNVGYGSYGNYGGTVNNPNGARRGGTNIVDSYSSPYLVFDNDNTSGTEFECSTGPGDSGGPMYLQNGYQWRVAAIVYGANSQGFIDTDVTHENFISTTTGIAFAPAAAPTALKWNSTYLNPTSNSSKVVTTLTDGAGTWDTTRLDFTDGNFTYAWENGAITGQLLLPVTFGVGNGAAGVVTLGTPINISNLTFAAPGSGAYNIAGTSANPLTLAAAGSSVTVNAGVTAVISAPLAGTGLLTKLGTGVLTLGGASTYTGGTAVSAGTLNLNTAGALGTSGNISVASGAALNVSTLGTSTGFTLAAGRTLTVNGSFTGTLSLSGTLTGTGVVGIGNGTNNNTLTVNAGGLVSGATGTLTIGNGLTNNGTITMPAGALLDASTAASFTNNGALNLTAGNAKLPGNFTNGSNGVLTNAGGTLAFNSGGITNNGTIRLTGGAVFDLTGATYVYNYGVIDLIDGSVKPSQAVIMNMSGGTVLTSDLLRIKSTTRTSTAVTVTVDSYTGHNYQLQRGTSPTASSFANLGSPQAGSTGTTLTFTDSSPATGQGFYRVVLSP
ncbi:MAG: trypsin-like serine protease [Gluconacetobacter diazotrophicus]|nr:trypsin-like serine protease [Gluconacetobacter diazotrophicus]